MKGGIVLTIIACIGIFSMYIFQQDTKRHYSEYNEDPNSDYSYWVRKYHKLPLFVMLLILGLLLIYTDLAVKYGWPYIEFFHW